MQRICVIVPYFGQWPRWFPVFLETCRHNSSIDWMFFTDLTPPAGAPSNVIFKPLTFEEFGRLAARQLNVQVNVTRPYKICDFKPTFGEIFREHLEDYDFWCYGDVDVYFGNVRHFLTEALLARYDVISCRAGFLAGEFTVLRNTTSTNRLFRESADFEKVFTSDKGYAFDEYGFFKDRKIDSMTHIVLREAARGRLRLYWDDMLRTDRKIKGRPFRYFWKQGQLIDTHTHEELLLYHFLDLKKEESFTAPQPPLDLQHGFFVSEKGVEICSMPYTPPLRLLPMLSAKAVACVRRYRNLRRLQQSVQTP